VRLLLDTHLLLWAAGAAERLSPQARLLLDDPNNELLFSAASLWEIAIKHVLARGAPSGMPISGLEALGCFREAGYGLLDISPAHVVALETLPPLHADPFDRILVAQALATPLRLLTHDPTVARYSDSIIRV